MNKQQLVDAVGERLGDRKTAAAAVEAVLDTVSGTLAAGERVSLFGFGVFEKVERGARTARNPATGGTVEVPASSVPRFRAGQALKDAVNGRPSRAARRGSTSEATSSEGGAASQATSDGTASKGRADGKAAKGKAGGKADGKASKGKSDGKAAKGTGSKGKGESKSKADPKSKGKGDGKASKGKRSAAG